MAKSTIEWTYYTLNPWEGCEKVSPGCKNCYAWRRDLRLHRGENWGPGSARLQHKDAYWRQPIRWNLEAEAAGQMRPVFCGSLCDILENNPLWGLDRLRLRTFDMIRRTPSLMWLLLTKRPENAIHFLPTEWYLDWPKNVMLGITGEDDPHFEKRAQILLRDIPRKAPLFLSAEPLLGGFYDGHMERLLPMFSWVIGGGESGDGARPMDPTWPRQLRDKCAALGIPFLFKQWGEWGPYGQAGAGMANALKKVGKKAAGRLLDGRTHDEFPKFWEGLNVVTAPADPLAVIS